MRVAELEGGALFAGGEPGDQRPQWCVGPIVCSRTTSTTWWRTSAPVGPHHTPMMAGVRGGLCGTVGRFLRGPGVTREAQIWVQSGETVAPSGGPGEDRGPLTRE